MFLTNLVCQILTINWKGRTKLTWKIYVMKNNNVLTLRTTVFLY